MKTWLYPVSGASGNHFRDTRGRRRATSYAEILDAVTEGVFPATLDWMCAQNGPNVESGDRLVLYTGERGVGIFAFGVVEDAYAGQDGRWVLRWKPDMARTKRLLAKPIEAPVVRKHVHPRVTVRDFTDGAKSLKRRLA